MTKTSMIAGIIIAAVIISGIAYGLSSRNDAAMMKKDETGSIMKDQAAKAPAGETMMQATDTMMKEATGTMMKDDGAMKKDDSMMKAQ